MENGNLEKIKAKELSFMQMEKDRRDEIEISVFSNVVHHSKTLITYF